MKGSARCLPADADLGKEHAMTTTTLDILVCGGGYVGLFGCSGP